MIKVNYDSETGRVLAFGKDSTPFIEITEEERRQPLPDKYSFYAVIDGKFTIQRREPTEAETAADNAAEIAAELADIQKWLNDNDWKINKIVIGEWEETDPRWVEYLAERAKKRSRHDELIAVEVD